MGIHSTFLKLLRLTTTFTIHSIYDFMTKNAFSGFKFPIFLNIPIKVIIIISDYISRLQGGWWRAVQPNLRPASISCSPTMKTVSQVCMHPSIHLFVYINIHTHMHKYIHTYLPTYLHQYIPTYIHTYTHTLKPPTFLSISRKGATRTHYPSMRRLVRGRRRKR